MRPFPPICKGCVDREVGCHKDCKIYQDARKEYERQAEAERQKKHKEHEVLSVEMDCKEKIRRRLYGIR